MLVHGYGLGLSVRLSQQLVSFCDSLVAKAMIVGFFFFLNFFSRPIVGTGIILHSWSQSTKSCFAFHIQTLLPIGLPRLLP